MAEAIIRQVWKNQKNNQKIVTIPNKCEIKEGDYVSIKKVEVSDG